MKKIGINKLTSIHCIIKIKSIYSCYTFTSPKLWIKTVSVSTCTLSAVYLFAKAKKKKSKEIHLVMPFETRGQGKFALS